MKIILIKKEKHRIYESEAMVRALFGKELSHNEKGAPLIDGGYISVTDTKEYWAAAVSDQALGIDMEDSKREVKASAVKKLHPHEQEYLAALSEGSSEWREEFLSIWVKKESYSKYLGKGFAAGFSKFSVLEDDEQKLERKLFLKKYKSLLIAATEDFSVEPGLYDAPMEKSALEAGADILDMLGCSAQKLSEKLIARGYSEEDASKAVDILIERGFLNDDEYSRSLSEKYANRGYSSGRIAFELMKKGVSKDTAQSWAAGYAECDYERAEKIADKLSSGKEIDEKLKARIAGKLGSFGYSAGIIYDIISGL